MKTIKNYWLALLAMMFVFAGCENGSSVDPRDAFVGTYDYATEGELTFMTKATFSLDSKGTFKIEKIGEKDSVLISDAIDGKVDPFKAIVKGDQLELVSNHIEVKGKTFEVLVTYTNTTAKMQNDTLVWDEKDLICVGTIAAFEMTGNGYVTMKATKKSVE